MRPGVFFLQIVTIVGAGERNTQFFVDLQEAVIRDALVLESIGLQFEVIIVFAENLSILAGGLGCSSQILLPNQIGDFSAQTA